MKQYILTILAIVCLHDAQAQQDKVIMANPLNLSYRFQKDGISRREAADPVIVLYKDRYYLFGSHMSGYHYSDNLRDWTYVQTRTLKAAEAWAPAVFVYNDAIYYMGMGERRIFRSTQPSADIWEEVPCELEGYGDPAFFQDTDGKVYLYYGCSDNAPIRGFEVDPEQGFRRIGPEHELIPHNAQRFGWEVFGERNEQYDKKGWNEGPCITRQGDFYYLMYGTPGTEFTCYCSPAYASRNPLGPYAPIPGSPFALKPGGFIRGGGHGHPFKDRYGNDWYVATLIVSAKEKFERRIGIFPAYYGEGYAHAVTDEADYPFLLPEKKMDFAQESLSAGMNLLSFGKSLTASSWKPGHEASLASDENMKTWWAASTGKEGEWLQMDLQRNMQIETLQVCFADEGSQTYRQDKDIPIQRYVAEYSTDGKEWHLLADRSRNSQDQIYELIALPHPVTARFVRITNAANLIHSQFSITDLRLFGVAKGPTPGEINGLTVQRHENRQRMSFTWEAENTANGYTLRWGTSPERINHAMTVYGTNCEAGFFDKEATYYVTLEAFNESGKGARCPIIRID